MTESNQGRIHDKGLGDFVNGVEKSEIRLLVIEEQWAKVDKNGRKRKYKSCFKVVDAT